MTRQEANWTEISIDSLSDAQRKAYDDYKAAYRFMKECREAFERNMAEGVPEGKRMLFGYNFGKLSVAIVVDDRKPAKAKQGKASLVDFLASASANGHRY